MLCRHLNERREPIKNPCPVRDAGSKMRVLSTFNCSLYGQCIPCWRPRPAELAAWNEQPESSMFRLCEGCESKAPHDLPAVSG
jgi:hypothetical protein